ncbi:MAG: 30S ribosomal protein S7 [Candidatus Aenigmarchaeota archaeon]|nr:30S ribosomal protein S7 [Candidatus Aenigmarchaeota archaeon]
MPDEHAEAATSKPVVNAAPQRGLTAKRGRTDTRRFGQPAPHKEPKKVASKPAQKVELPHLKLFGRWDSNVEVSDHGLKAYVNLKPCLLPRSGGVYRRPFHKSKMHIAERLALHMMVPGHRGRHHELSSGRFGGGMMQTLGAVEKAMEIIETKEKKNPVEVMVRALENSAAREEITSYQLGSIVARDAVITSPQRRVDKTLRNFAQGTYRRSFGKKKSIAEALAEELISASKGSNDSHAIKEKERLEREAIGTR